jgi:phage-related protein
MDNEILTNDNIDKLLKADDTFMYKLSLLKNNILKNLGDYADSWKDIDVGFFTDEDNDKIQEAKGNILDSWSLLSDKFKLFEPKSLDAEESLDGDSDATSNEIFDKDIPSIILDGLSDNAVSQFKEFSSSNSILDNITDAPENLNDSASGVFDKEVPSVIINSLDSDAIKQLKSVFGGSASGDLPSGATESSDAGGGGGMVGDVLGGVLSGILARFGMKVPDFITRLAVQYGGVLMPVIAIAGGILWAAIDGIRGFFMSDEWGVSKVSGSLGAILGGMGSGFTGAISNMGKWALIGGGIGFFAGGPPGAIAGALIGAAIGAILGWIGGERIAKGFDAVGRWFKSVWDDIIDGVATVLGWFMYDIPKAWNDAVAIVKDSIDWIMKIVSKVWTATIDAVNKGIGWLMEVVPKVWTATIDAVNKGITWLTEAVPKAWKATIASVSKGMKWLTNVVPKVWSEIVGLLKQGIGWIMKIVPELWGKMIATVKRVWGELTAGFEDGIIIGIKHFAKTLVEKVTNLFKKIGAGVKTIATNIWTFINTKVKDFWNDLTSGFKDGFVKGVTHFGEVLYGKIRELLTKFADILPDTLSKGVRAVISILDNITAKISAGFKALMSANIGDIFKGIYNSIIGVFKKIGNIVIPFVSKIWDGIKEFGSKFWGVLSAGFKAFMATKAGKFIKGVYDSISAFLGKIANILKPILDKAWKAISAFGSKVWLKIVDGFNKFMSTKAGQFVKGIYDKISGFFGKLANIFTPILTKAWTAIKSAVTGIWDSVTSGFKTIMGSTVGEVLDIAYEKISGLFKKMAGILGPIIKNAWATITSSISNIWSKLTSGFKNLMGTTIGDFFKNMLTNIKNLFSSIASVFGPLLSKIWTGIKSIFGNLWGKLSPTINKLLSTKVGQFLKGMYDKISGLLGKVFGIYKSFFTKAWDGIKSIAGKAVALFGTFMNTKVGQFFKGIYDSISGLLGKVFGIFKPFLTKAWNAIKSYVGKAWSTVTSIFSGLMHTTIGDFFKNIYNNIKGLIGNLFNMFKFGIPKAWNAIKSYLGVAWNKLTSIFSGLMNTTIGDFLKNIYNKVKGFFTKIADIFGPILKTAWKRIVSAITKIWGGLKLAFDFIMKSKLGAFFKFIGKKISGIWTSLTTKLKEVFSLENIKRIGSTIGDFLGNIKDAVKEFWGKIFTKMKESFSPKLISNIANKVPEFLKKMGKIVGEWIKELWNNIKNVGKNFINKFRHGKKNEDPAVEEAAEEASQYDAAIYSNIDTNNKIDDTLKENTEALVQSHKDQKITAQEHAALLKEQIDLLSKMLEMGKTEPHGSTNISQVHNSYNNNEVGDHRYNIRKHS